MANYTDEEIQTAVEQLVQNTIARPYDTLGVRRTDIAFSEIQQAAAGVFLLYPEAPFYCLYLGAQRALQSIAAEAALVDQLIAAIKATGRSVLPIEDVTPLFNAKAALQALGQAATDRSSSFTDITALPAYQRFTDNIDRFVQTNGQSIKDNGQIVSTPQEAKKLLSPLVGQLQDVHQTLISQIQALSKGEDDYNNLNLGSLVISNVISKATTRLSSRADELSLLQPEQRLEIIRATVLDLLAIKSVVTTYGSFQGSTDIYGLTGTGFPYSDSSHLADPAVLTASIAAPYNCQKGNNALDLFLDGVGLTPRSLTTATSLTPTTGTEATLTVVSVPDDVLASDVLYVRSGPNNGAKFSITSLGTTTIGLAGLVVPSSDAGPITIEVLPAPSASITLPYSYAASLNGIVAEQQYPTGIGFIIGNGTAPIRPIPGSQPNNDSFVILINGTPTTIPLTDSADGVVQDPTIPDPGTEATPRTAEQICADINPTLNPLNFKIEPYFNPRRFVGLVSISNSVGSSADFTLLGGFGNFGSLGIVVGNQINVLDGDGTQLGYWDITAVTSTVLSATMVSLGTAIDQAQVTIEVGPKYKCLRIVAVDPHLAVANETRIALGNSTAAAAGFCATLGFTPAVTVTSRPQTAKEIAKAITTGTSLATASTTLVGAVLTGRTEPSLTTRLISSKFFGSVNTTWSGPTLTVTGLDPLSLGIAIGDKVVERSGNNVGTVYAVSAVTSTSVSATSVSGTPSSQVGVVVDIGTAPTVSAWGTVRIQDGQNTGDYYVDSVSVLDITLKDGGIPVPSNPTNNQPLTFSMLVGSEYLQVQSLNKTTASWVKARGNAEASFFNHNNGQAGTSKYFRLPAKVKDLRVGDLLAFFASQYNIPSSFAVIRAVEDTVITLDQSLPSNVSWSFGNTVPFARLISAHTSDFQAFKGLLDDWLVGETQQAGYFTDLNRFINPLISNSSPSAVQVGDAVNRVTDLLKKLTTAGAALFNGTSPLESALNTYNVDKLPAVDALLRAFQEKGADRAVDALTGGAFTLFFGMDQDDASYAGNMQKAMRSVILNDLPVRKVNRPDVQRSRLLASTQSPDPEYNFDDAETAVPDPPGQGEF